MPKPVTKKEQKANMDFVLEIEKYPCIYNYTIEDYSKRDVVDAAWEKVSEAYGDTAENCKKKWKNLRTVFVRNLRLRGNAYEKRAYYLNEVAQFLVPYLKVQTTNIFPSNRQSPTSEGEDRDSVKIKEDPDESEPEIDYKSSDEGAPVQYGPEAADTRNNLSCTPVGEQIKAQEPGSSEKAKTGENSDVKIKRKANNPVHSFAEYFQEKKKKLHEPAESYRKSFLLSLLPEVESMSASQFRVFRRSILDAIDNAFD